MTTSDGIPRHFWFSNPNITYKGVPTGVVGISEAAIMGEVMAETAQHWRQAKSSSTCTPDSFGLCLNQGRFRVMAAWQTGDGRQGIAEAFPVTGDTGNLWFFHPDNVEVVVKVIDGCGTNGKYWVFAGGLTNVEVTLLVVDTATGAEKEYVNPQGKAFQPIQDTVAFPCN